MSHAGSDLVRAPHPFENVREGVQVSLVSSTHQYLQRS